MRHALVAVLLCTIASAGPVLAQTQPTVTPDMMPAGHAQAKATIVRCGQLIALIGASAQPSGVTVEQARQWAAANEGDRCASSAERLIQTGSAR